MNIWFTSDEHYGHENIIKFCNRPYSGINQMAFELIANHNEVVGKDDLTYHLGDMFWKTLDLEEAKEIVRRLNGRHAYVFGNHEELMEGSIKLPALFDGGVFHRTQIYPQGEGLPKKGIVLDHYAGRVWHDSDKGSWQLYGHTHGVMPEMDPLLSMDVGVDVNNYFPIHIDAVRDRMTKKIKRIQRQLGVSSKKA